jgi:hypothetical protein
LAALVIKMAFCSAKSVFIFKRLQVFVAPQQNKCAVNLVREIFSLELIFKVFSQCN